MSEPLEPTTNEGPDPGSRLDAEDERRQHVAFVLVRIVRIIRAALPSAVGIGIGLRAIGLPGGGSTIAIGVALVAVAAIVVVTVEWWRTRYAVVDGSLRVRQGLLQRSERIVPRARIAALDTSRGPVQRIFGLVSLKVQTAGGGKAAEVELPTISFAEVDRLRGLLGHGRTPSGAPSGGDADTTDEPRPRIYAIGTRELVVAALSGPQIGVVAVLIGSVVSQLDDVVPRSVRHDAESVVSSSSVTTLLLLGAGLAIVAAVLAVVGTVLAYARFTVERDGSRLRIRRGLLTDRTATVEIDRVHGVRIVEGIVRRRLGYAAVQVEVAGYRREDEFTRTLVPLVRTDRLATLLPALVPDLAWTGNVLQRPPARARRRYWTGPLRLFLVPILAAVVVLPGSWKLVALAGVLLAVGLGERRWRGAGWSLEHDTLVVRWQMIARTTLLMRRDRIQLVRTRATAFQRRARLAGFGAALATRRRGIVSHLDEDVAVALREAVVGRLPLHSDAPAGVAQSVRAAES
jgi:putative membrane protein